MAVTAMMVSSGNAMSAAVQNSELPMTKAINLLKDMKKDLEREQKDEEDTYALLDCWCKKNDGEKKASIEAAQQKIDELQAAIEKASGETGQFSTLIDQMKNDVEEGKKAIAEATEIRNKEAAAFHEQETDLIQSITLLNGAITALNKHDPAMIQSGEQQSSAVRKMLPSLRHLVHSHLSDLGFLQDSEQQKDTLLAFLNAEPDLLDSDGIPNAFVQQKAVRQHSFLPYRSYAPQSGQVLGVLKQLKDALEADLPEAQKEETAKASAFAEMKGAKEAEIKDLEEQIEAKTADLAAAKETLANGKGELEDTREAMDADNAFLQEMVVKCTEGDKESQRRKVLRADEIAAVAEAITILTTDEVKDAQQTTFGSFLQVASTDKKRAKAVRLLQRAAAKAPELALLLQTVRMDPFTKVIEAIDKLAAQLKEQQADEVKKNDFCINELHENQVDSERTDAKLAELAAKVEDLTATGKTLTSEIEQLTVDIANLQVELQRATEDRKTENHEFQHVVADQKRARDALDRAHDRLVDFYGGKGQFIQLQQEPEQKKTIDNWVEAPELKKEHKYHSSSQKILLLLQKLGDDARLLEEASIHGEQEAESSYESLVDETNGAVKAKTRLIADKKEELASVDEERLQTETEHGEQFQARIALADSEKAIHQSCDFLLQNFATRQEARASEADALAEVKAVLSGMSPNAA